MSSVDYIALNGCEFWKSYVFIQRQCFIYALMSNLLKCFVQLGISKE